MSLQWVPGLSATHLRVMVVKISGVPETKVMGGVDRENHIIWLQPVFRVAYYALPSTGRFGSKGRGLKKAARWGSCSWNRPETHRKRNCVEGGGIGGLLRESSLQSGTWKAYWKGNKGWYSHKQCLVMRNRRCNLKSWKFPRGTGIWSPDMAEGNQQERGRGVFQQSTVHWQRKLKTF